MSKRPALPSNPDENANLSVGLQEVFGENVRRQRTKLGLKQSEVSDRTGIAQGVISKIENGQVNLTLRQMSRLAQVLDGEVGNMLQSLRAKKDDA